ncbi:DUF6477 family protein [Defluviimonas sp. WL0024]|uniref:DUF6477 family protein n=2 Tax=Albidovulum TaxID=205889 RepID=A0ABT3J0E2_9RHOB|nr:MULTISPECIES: DUF6477 family protein [Defluviimonas]MCU9846894.1 DUF6477 family protein [Defluviimonas sp. WL0024]MCW3781153.1 DUF6477 family protein [Defluviimonas salinarum]
MSDLLSLVSELRRPRLLIRAARAGLAEYNRSRDLRRVIRVADTPAPERALSALLAEEERLEATRQAGDASYSFIRHIEVLIAMMAEARLLPQPGRA